MAASPESLFPTISFNGTTPHIVSAEQAFHIEHIGDEKLERFIGFVMQTLDLIGNGICNFGKPDDTFPWLKEWYESVDEWVGTNGIYLPAPIESGDFLSMCGYLNRESPDHIDAPANMPIGLSVGIYGVRELVGVVLESPEECAEVLDELSRTGMRLRDQAKINDRPVERITIRPWDIAHIATYACIHSGGHAPEAKDGSNALAIGYNGSIIPGHEDKAQEHFEAVYFRGAMGELHDTVRDQLLG